MDNILDIQQNIRDNEKLFRAVLRDAKTRDTLIPREVNPEAPLEELLAYVSEGPKGCGQFSIYVFSKGPVEHWVEDIAENKLFFGYDQTGVLTGGGAILQYGIISENEVRYDSEVIRTRS